jgi:phosphate-selective porin OprO/OprP
MKKALLIAIILGGLVFSVKSQTPDDVLNILIRKNLIAQKEADSIRAEAAIAAQASQAKVKSFPISAGKKIAVAGYTQVRYQALEETGKADGFDIRRARLDIKGNISPYWAYRLQFDLAGTAKIIDAYAELKLNDYFNFTIGQSLIPLSLENLTSSSKYEMIEFAQSVDALAARGKDVVGNQNGHDLGIQVGGTLLKMKNRPVLDYRLGVFNGSGINVADNNEAKDLAGRLVAHPIAGLDLGMAIYNGSRFVPEVKTGAVVTTPSKNVTRDRYGFDLNYELKNFSLRSEYLHGTDDAIDREGYYVQGGYYFLDKKLQVLAKYDFYDSDKAVEKNASTWLVLGANLNLNANTRIQFNYTFKQEEGTSINNNLAAVQAQIGF